MKNKSTKGFTLIEILLVVAILAILAGIVILAINPQKQLLDARNAQRRADVSTILSAVYQYSIDNKGVMPGASTIPVAPTAAIEVCTSAVSATCTAASLADLSAVIAAEKYLTAIPVDPAGGATNGAGYTIQKTANNRITVTAPAVGNYAAYSATK